MTPLLDKASLRSRLRDTRGFMIAEQLTSIVFIGLLCVAVGVGLQVAMNSYASITRQAQADALLQQAVEVVSDELTYARDVEGEGTQAPDNPLYFTSPTRHDDVGAAIERDWRRRHLAKRGWRAVANRAGTRRPRAQAGRAFIQRGQRDLEFPHHHRIR